MYYRAIQTKHASCYTMRVLKVPFRLFSHLRLYLGSIPTVSITRSHVYIGSQTSVVISRSLFGFVDALLQKLSSPAVDSILQLDTACSVSVVTVWVCSCRLSVVWIPCFIYADRAIFTLIAPRKHYILSMLKSHNHYYAYRSAHVLLVVPLAPFRIALTCDLPVTRRNVPSITHKWFPARGSGTDAFDPNDIYIGIVYMDRDKSSIWV